MLKILDTKLGSFRRGEFLFGERGMDKNLWAILIQHFLNNETLMAWSI
jgi:hypothetical protein